MLINFSAVDRQQYSELHGKDFFDRVVNNIKRLVSLRDASKPGFKIEISYIVNTININQKQKMRDLAFQLGVNGVYFSGMHANAYNWKIALPEGSIEGEKNRTPSSCLNGWFSIAVKIKIG